MRVKRCITSLLSLAMGLALHAQVEPNLLTTTDLSDVYQSKAAQTKLVLILDSTAASRGVFESYEYLTNKARRAFLGKDNGMGGKPSPGDLNADSVFSKPGAAGTALNTTHPILGYVFGMRGNGDDAEVRLYTWPSGTPLTVRTAIGGNSEVIGRPYAYKGSGSDMDKVNWQTDAATTLANGGNPVTHVRFTVNGRTVDVPCPWRIFDSPGFVTQPPAPTKAVPFPVIPVYQRNFQRNQTYQSGHTGIPYDVYSDDASNRVRTIAGYPATDQILGQFYYSPDYLSWIFYGKSVRGDYQLTGNKAGTVDWKANPYGYSGGYAVPSVDDTVTLSVTGGTTVTGKGQGFANHLPVLTRFQAQKMAVINAFVDKWDLGTWYYRFLAPGYGDASNDEELLATAYATPSVYRADRSDADTNPSYLSDLRNLTGSLLTAHTSALQKIGPRDMVGTQTLAAQSFGANVTTLDAFTPGPTAVALANTYRKIVRDTNKFTTDCGGGVVVVPLMASPMNDSLTDYGDQKAAYVSNNTGYYSYTHGNTGLSKGGSNYPDNSVKADMAASTFKPGSDLFHPAVMSATAAFGLNGVTNNAADYDAPWNDPASKTTAKIQTMAISLAVPGTYVLASDNNGRNPHEEFFDMADFGNPSNPHWAPSNPAPSADLVYYYNYLNTNSARYFPTADPASLEQALASVASTVVFGKAALSAPATPATGIQNANQAYFGTFQTTANTTPAAKVPLWTGNLYSIGLKRTTVPGTALGSVQNVIQFYGVDDTNNQIATINNVGTNTADFDVLNLWSAFAVFGRYQSATVNTDKLLGNAALSWRGRKAYIVSGSNDLETYTHSANGSSSNTTQLTRIQGWITAKDPTNRYFLSQAVTASGTPSLDSVRNLMRFILGAFDPTGDTNLLNRDKSDQDLTTHALLGHLNIMGDIVNSAPMAVELSRNLADLLGGPVTTDSFYTAAYGSSYSDPHTRLVVVGTNTGNLHCFVEVAAKGSDGYYHAKATELWTFLPPNLFPMLWDLYNNQNTTDQAIYKHHYGVDGDPALYHLDKAVPTGGIGDTRVSVGEDAAIIVGFRKGARDYFSLKLSDSNDTSVTPAAPRLAWWIRPITGDIVRPSSTNSGNQALLRTMGMSSSVPAFGRVQDSTGNVLQTLFLTGGYTNAQVNANYLNDDAWAGTSYFQKGLGRMVLAMDPMTGDFRTTPWDFTTTGAQNVGAVAGGVVPVTAINVSSRLTHRIYFGDVTGSVWAINSTNSATTTAFRSDSAKIGTWATASGVRKIFSDDNVRFTNAPDAVRLVGDFPVPIPVGSVGVRPLTVLVAIGSGDRNNPIDAQEDYSYTTKTGSVVNVPQNPAAYNRFYVLADLQNASNPLATSDLQQITSSWATSYNDAKVTAGSSSYLWGTYNPATNTGGGNKFGWYFDLPHNDSSNPFLAPAGNSPNLTRDKVMVAPLIKLGAVFYSFFNIFGSSGFACSPFATTRTFRQCDMVRPLWVDPQTSLSAAKVGDITGGTGSAATDDNCSGIAFSFNSLSSQLVDSGDYVIQGGAKASTVSGVQGSNTPDVQAVKDTVNQRGFRVRAWRVVH